MARNCEPRRPDRQLVGLGAEQAALDADAVAEVEQLEDLEVALGQRVLADVDLDPRPAVGETRKFALPKVRIARIRPAVTVCDAFGLELGPGLLAERVTRSWTVCVRSNACG